MPASHIDLKTDLLLENLARRFEIDETFVDISDTGSGDGRNKYRCELKFITTGNSLKKFHLSVYTFYFETQDEQGFWYEDIYYSYDEINNFLDRLERQLKEPDNK